MQNFGKEAKDKITGFVGLITAKCDYMYGCSQYGLSPKVDKEGKTRDMGWFDIGRIEILGEGIEVKSVQAERPGCEFQEHP